VINSTLPEFWVCDPNKWFESIEGTFTFLNIGSSQTKYQMAIGVILGDCLDVVRDQVHRNPGEYPDPYGELKMRLTGTPLATLAGSSLRSSSLIWTWGTSNLRFSCL
jgi:hypothetical protein